MLNANIHCTDILQVINSGTCGNDITWTLYNDGELVIEGSGEMTQIYTSDQSPWYSYRSMITSVSIEGDVTSISNFAFYGCSALVTATIPSTVLSVGSSAFRGCDSLQDVYYGGTQSEWEILEKSVNSTGNSYLLEANIHYAVQNDEAANDGEDSHAENDANDTADADNVGNADDGDPEIPDASGNAQNVFTDVPDDAWYHDVVYSADANGYMNGYSGTSNFGPEDNLTRGQSAIIAYKMSGGTYYADNPNGQSGLSTQFSDCPEGAYYNYAINWAAGLGIVTGYENNGSLIYDPDGNVSREQFAAILARYAQVYGNYSAPSSTEISTLLASYDDGDAVSDWSKEYVAWAVKEEIMGQNTPSLNPLGDITRAEAAAMIVRLQPNPI
ncbi:MAG: S-layer homology domain-containing protein [Eggerthellaceae bacterium]|nr:S-layer homology domain-containing protein [Eggerthellaceae bacterium]